MRDVMLDLETMGNGPRAAIVAIGAVEFDPETGTVGERFYQAVDLATAVSMGGEMDASTVLWWMQQGDEARAAFAKGGAHLSKALHEFIESDRTWENCGEKVSALAQKQVGSWLVGGLKTALMRIFWLGIGAAVIWQFFGWTGLVSFVKGSAAK